MDVYRDIPVEEMCVYCGGSGYKCYATTAGWRGGIGGSMLTYDVCNKCWGSGNKDRPWTNLKEVDSLKKELEKCKKALAKFTSK